MPKTIDAVVSTPSNEGCSGVFVNWLLFNAALLVESWVIATIWMWFFVPMGMPQIGIAQVFGAHIIIQLLTNGRDSDNWAVIKFVKMLAETLNTSEQIGRVTFVIFRLVFAPINLGIAWLVGTIFGWPL